MKTYEKIENTENGFLKIDVYYSKGGINYWSGGVDKRGYWVSVQKVERTICNGYTTESFMVGSGGVRSFLLEVKRQSPKALAQAQELAKSKVDELKVAVLNGRY